MIRVKYCSQCLSKYHIIVRIWKVLHDKFHNWYPYSLCPNHRRRCRCRNTWRIHDETAPLLGQSSDSCNRNPPSFSFACSAGSTPPSRDALFCSKRRKVSRTSADVVLIRRHRLCKNIGRSLRECPFQTRIDKNASMPRRADVSLACDRWS